MDATCFKTTIDRDMGRHEATGLRITELHDVVTRFGDYSHDSWEGQDEDAREWWNETLRDIHAAMIGLESIPAWQRQKAGEQSVVFRDSFTAHGAPAQPHCCPSYARELQAVRSCGCSDVRSKYNNS